MLFESVFVFLSFLHQKCFFHDRVIRAWEESEKGFRVQYKISIRLGFR